MIPGSTEERDRYAEAIAELIEHRGCLRQLMQVQALLGAAVIGLAICLAVVVFTLL